MTSLTKVLIIHNIAWSHYKARVFSEFFKLCKRESIEMKVIHIAMNERGRTSLGKVDLSLHQYPFEILFDSNYEETSVLKRTTRLLRVLRSFKPNVVLLPGYNDLAYWFVLVYCKLTKRKVIVVMETNEFDKEKRPLMKEFLKGFFIKTCDAVFACGTASKKYAERLGAKSERIFIVHLTSDTEVMKSSCEHWRTRVVEIKREYRIFKEHNFVYVGRISPEKNLKTLIEAFYELKRSEERSMDWGLVLVGDGPQRKDIEQLVVELGLQKDVVFVGGVPWRDVAKFYAVSDVFVLPSLSEPWGLVVNEAMACGLPVVVSKRAGAYYDLVKDGINGFGFEPTDKYQLVEIMKKFVIGFVDLDMMKKASEEIIRSYIPQNSAREMMEGIMRTMIRR